MVMSLNRFRKFGGVLSSETSFRKSYAIWMLRLSFRVSLDTDGQAVQPGLSFARL